MRQLPRGAWPAVLAAAAETFPPGNRYGVFGYGIHKATCEGRAVNGDTLVVYVERKHRIPDEPVPPVEFTWRNRRRAVLPDIRAIGRHPQATWGGKTAFSGLHPGALIAINASPTQYGGVGCILGDDDGPSHLLSAGHLFPEDAEGMAVIAAMPGDNALVVGQMQANLLDSAPKGFPAIDVALIELNDVGRRMAQVTNAGPVLGQLVGPKEIQGKRAQAFLSTTNDYSPQTEALLRPAVFYVESNLRGRYEVTDVIQTSSGITEEGDSGTVLMTANARRDALGTCVGGSGSALSLFEPLFRARDALSATVDGLSFTLWSP